MQAAVQSFVDGLGNATPAQQPNKEFPNKDPQQDNQQDLDLLDESGLFGQMRDAATLEETIALGQQIAQQRTQRTQLAFANDRPEDEATDAPSISAADRDAAAEETVVQLATANGIRDEGANRKLLNFEMGEDIKVDGTPEQVSRFNRLAARAMVLDPSLEELVINAQLAGVGMNIALATGDETNMFVGASGAAATRGEPGTAPPLIQLIDMSDIEQLPSATNTAAPGHRFGQEVALSHEIRELIGISMLSDLNKINGPKGLELFELAHQDAESGEAFIRRLTEGPQLRNRIQGRDHVPPLRGSTPGTVKTSEMRYASGGSTYFDIGPNHEILGIRPGRAAPRSVPTPR